MSADSMRRTAAILLLIPGGSGAVVGGERSAGFEFGE